MSVAPLNIVACVVSLALAQQLTIINILLEADAGVIETDKVFEAVTKEVDVVLLDVESVAVTT